MSIQRDHFGVRKQRPQLVKGLKAHVGKVVFVDDMRALLAAQIAAGGGFNE